MCYENESYCGNANNPESWVQEDIFARDIFIEFILFMIEKKLSLIIKNVF